MTLSAKIQQVVNDLMAYEPEKIILFGSAARGDTDEYSDIDLIVIKDTDQRFIQRLVDAASFLSPYISVDVLVYTPAELKAMIEAENPFIQQALEEGKVLYEKTGCYSERSEESRPLRRTPAPLETAKRWLAQAEHSLSMSRVLFNNGFWSGVCFQSEQTAQFALKAFLYYKGRRFIHIHSIRELVLECGKEDQEFLGFLTYGMTLDKYYTSTRYPDALPEPAVPFESFTEQEANEALLFATEMVELTRAKITN